MRDRSLSSSASSTAIGIALAGIAFASAFAGQASAASEVALRALMRDGSWARADLVSITDGSWKVARNGAKDAQVLRAEDVVAFIVERSRGSSEPAADSEVPTPLSYGLIEFANGQRLPGNFRVARDANLWDHRWIGAIPLDLEQIATLRLRGARTPERRAEGDTLLLLNGDVLTGFIESIGEDVAFEPLAQPEDAPDTKPERRTISTDRIAAIALARSEAPRSDAMRIWSIDGSLVDARGLAFDEQRGWNFELVDPLLAKIRAARTTESVPPAANPIAGLLKPGQLVPLASAGKPTVSVPAEHHHFGIERAVRVGASDRALLGLAPIELAGPIVARFPRPPLLDGVDGTATFTCDFALAEPAPRDARVEIEVRIGDGPAARISLDAQTRRSPLVVPGIPLARAGTAGQVEITLTDGGNGIAGDSVILERACFILSSR